MKIEAATHVLLLCYSLLLSSNVAQSRRCGKKKSKDDDVVVIMMDQANLAADSASGGGSSATRSKISSKLFRSPTVGGKNSGTVNSKTIQSILAKAGINNRNGRTKSIVILKRPPPVARDTKLQASFQEVTSVLEEATNELQTVGDEYSYKTVDSD